MEANLGHEIRRLQVDALNRSPTLEDEALVVTGRWADATVQSGFPKIIVKTDNEPAVLELKHVATPLTRELTAIAVVLEDSNEYVSQTGSFVQQAVQAVERKVPILNFSVKEPHGKETVGKSKEGRRHGHGAVWTALETKTVRVSAESKAPWQDLPDAPKPSEVENRRVCIRKDEDLGKYRTTEG